MMQSWHVGKNQLYTLWYVQRDKNYLLRVLLCAALPFKGFRLPEYDLYCSTNIYVHVTWEIQTSREDDRQA